MNRRVFLAVTGGALLAGCSSPSDGSGDGGGIDDSEDADSPSPTASATASPTRTPLPEPDTQEFQGRGDTATDAFQLAYPGPAVFGTIHKGQSNFIVHLVDADTGQEIELLANDIGSHAMLNMYRVDTDRQYALNVQAGGSWNIFVSSLPVARTGSDPAGEYSADYGEVHGPLRFSGGEVLEYEFRADSNNVLYLRNTFGGRADLLVNTIGPERGSTRLGSDGIGYLDARTNGRYSLTIE